MPSIAQLEAMLKKQPDDAFLHFGLAMELAKVGRVDEALGQFDRAIAIDGNYHAAYYHKGNTLLSQERIEEARAALAAGVEAAGRAGDGHAEMEMQELLASASG